MISRIFRISRLNSVCGRVYRYSTGTTEQNEPSQKPGPSVIEQLMSEEASHVKTAERRPAFRTNYTDPSQHSLHQEGQFYTVPNQHYETWLHHFMPVDFTKDVKTFQECCLMVRKPALETIHYMKNANYDVPVIRYILYGNHGTGKSLSLAHVIHYCAVNNWIILTASSPATWLWRCKDISVSTYKPGRVDLPIQSVEWLKQFRIWNGTLLKQLQLKTSKQYTWSKREMTEEGSDINAIIDQGINRPKYASDCIGVIMKELREQTTKRGFKTLVAIDGVNALWGTAQIKDEQGKIVPTECFTLLHHFKKALQANWNGGAVVATVDVKAQSLERRESWLPKYLLAKEGFEWLDPFIPIEVQKYSEKEIHSCMDYYEDRLWIQHPEGKTTDGRQQLVFLSDHNPLALNQVCASCA
ncbi:small ribosomal subunit protein mS29-like [Tubulanus polymorphus]|uniref:small ribosomal subunit protein mS29-like n=1 Tax=Tubulanus polymorphus TaxID=672921 RepID=UPI003DA57915